MTWESVTDSFGGWRRRVPDPDTLVIVLHGFGRSGENIKTRLAEPLSRGLPHAAFYAPDGFERYEGDDHEGRQWFSRQNVTPATRLERLRAAHPKLQQLIADELARVKLPPERLVLAGFSQGAIFSLHHVATQPQRLAAVVAYSGRLATPVEARNGTPVTIVHGTADGNLDDVATGARQLEDAGHPVDLKWLDGLEHDLSADGVGIGVAAIRNAGSRA
jgi:phospholipase/carboxylesterase